MKAEYVVYKDSLGYFIMAQWEWDILDQYSAGKKCIMDISFAKLLQLQESSYAAQDILSRIWSGNYGSYVENT